MNDGMIYFSVIDPLLRKLHKAVAKEIPEGAKVIDVACGNGTLPMMYADLAAHVTGIDLDTGKLVFARKTAARRRYQNMIFIEKDATDLSDYEDASFDIATISMAIHQFDLRVAMRILNELQRIAGQIIIADYRFPLPNGFPGLITRTIERLAGSEHHRHFRNYLEFGGLPAIIENMFNNNERQLKEVGSVFQLAVIHNSRHSLFS